MLKGRQSLWAISGAFGDNLHQLARKVALQENLSDVQISSLQTLGELFNYNGYGSSLEDLHFHPKELYRAIQPYGNPFDFLENAPQMGTLQQGYEEDIELALQQPELQRSGKNRVYCMPDRTWARRVTGVFSNLRAREKPDSAHAVITENRDGTLRISVRAPLSDKRDADTLCKRFATGGGRAGAAGINSLPKKQFDDFLEQYQAIYR